jgi:hypothetical protein
MNNVAAAVPAGWRGLRRREKRRNTPSVARSIVRLGLTATPAFGPTLTSPSARFPVSRTNAAARWTAAPGRAGENAAARKRETALNRPPTARNRFGDVHNAIRSPRQSRDEGTRLKGCGTNRERRRSAPGNAGAHRESADPEPMYTDKRSHRHNGERCASRGSDHLPIRSGQAGTASHVLTARRIDGPPFTPSGKAPASHSTNVI